MSLRSFGTLCVFLSLLSASSLSFGQGFTDVIVDCTGATPGAFTSLNQAIANSPDNSDFQVIGTCTESVGVTIQNRRNLVIIADPTATIQTTDPGGALIVINHSQNIEIDNLTLNGGAGVDIFDSSTISLIGNTIENSSFFGIDSNNSDVLVLDGTVTGSTRSGVVTSGGTMQIDGVNISNNGRIGISAATTHLIISDGNSPTIVSNNGVAGVQLTNSSQGDFFDLQITNNAGNNFGLQAFTNTAVIMQGGSISGNTGVGVNCGSTTTCEFSQTQINGNFGAGIQVTTHGGLALDGGVQITGNQGVGVLIDQASTFASNGGNTISGNTGDGLVVNALSALNFLAPDTITATANNLALNCNNGSLVTGDISTYKPKKCGTAFQAVPIH